jgi:signal recognition particle receptor subunit beta
MQLDFTSRELTIKLVYYGPALSGKTTNLQALHAASSPEATGRLMTLETRDDRTLFFDLLPLTFGSEKGLSVRLKVFTVPGQVIHSSTRRLVLQGADGVAFIADSRIAETENNAESFRDLRENLKQNGINPKQIPLVLQFNKRDMADIRTETELAEMAAQGKEPVYLATALKGLGVVDTFVALLHLTWQTLDAHNGLVEKFGFDTSGFFADVLAKLNDKRPLSEIVSNRLNARTPSAKGAPR